MINYIKERREKTIIYMTKLVFKSRPLQKTDVKQLLEETTDAMEPLAETKQISLNLIFGEDVPEISVDRNRIKQVVDNLVNNAVKFSPDGSIINIQAKKNHDFVKIEVRDEGIGIPKEKQQKIFEPFYQIDSGADRIFGGTGLGLSICRGIVLGHGGKIGVESQQGNGSTFYFTIPIKSKLEDKGYLKKINIFEIDEENKNSLEK